MEQIRGCAYVSLLTVLEVVKLPLSLDLPEPRKHAERRLRVEWGGGSSDTSTLHNGTAKVLMLTLKPDGLTEEAHGPAGTAGDPWLAARTQPFSSRGPFFAKITDNMTTLDISIEGSLLHVSRGLARKTAQKEPLLKLMDLMLMIVMVIFRGAANKSSCSLGHSLR